MLCARVMRGISSTANEVTPRSAISCKVFCVPSGRRKPISTWPLRSNGRSSAPFLVVCAVAEELHDNVSCAETLRRGRAANFAPLSTYSLSE